MTLVSPFTKSFEMNRTSHDIQKADNCEVGAAMIPLTYFGQRQWRVSSSSTLSLFWSTSSEAETVLGTVIHHWSQQQKRTPITGYWHCQCWHLIGPSQRVGAKLFVRSPMSPLLTLSFWHLIGPSQNVGAKVNCLLGVPCHHYWHCHYWHPIGSS